MFVVKNTMMPFGVSIVFALCLRMRDHRTITCNGSRGSRIIHNVLFLSQKERELFGGSYRSRSTSFMSCLCACHRESMECLIKQHTYARSPLRACADADYEHQFKLHYEQSKGECRCMN